MCTITSKIDTPFSTLPDWTNPKEEKYKRLNCELTMVPSGASLEFNVYFNGRRMGGSSVTVKFN